MKYFTLLIILLFTMGSIEIVDFNKNSNIEKWVIIDDVVMGGRSSGSFRIDADGNGAFEGSVSLENNGGFSSVRYQLGNLQIDGNTRIILRIKGDGKKYQFRIKANSSDSFSYIYSFATTGEWEQVEIPLGEMYPSFRGRRLSQPNFSNNYMEELAFLIGNKKEETFKLLIDKIELK